jgi:hypothetical protein
MLTIDQLMAPTGIVPSPGAIFFSTIIALRF